MNKFIFLGFCISVNFLLFSCTRRTFTGNIKVFQNLRIGEIVTIHQANAPYAPCEPSIAIQRINTDTIVAGAVLNHVYRSFNGGKSWEKDQLRSSYGVYGDPVIRSNDDGSFLYAHLSLPSGRAYSSPSFLDRIVVQKSTNGGISWSNGTYPAADTIRDHDKHWICPGKNGNVLMSWTEFDKYGDTSSTCKTRILFSKSGDGGVTWSSATDLSTFEGDCEDDDFTAEGAYPCIGANGEYYVVWSRDESVWMNRSVDEGKSWLQQEVKIAHQSGGWAMDIPGVERCNGMPVIKCDLSGGMYHGRLYVLWADQRNGTENTDVWISLSDNQGASWSDPILVNTGDTGKHQYFPWMDIDQTSGKLYVVFYDRRHSKDTSTHMYLAVSDDGASSFTNIRLTDRPFRPRDNGFFGDYNDISAHAGRIRPVWTWQEGNSQSIQTILIDEIR